MKNEAEKSIEVFKDFLDQCHLSSPANYYMSELVRFVYPAKKISFKKVLNLWDLFLKEDSQGGDLNFYTHIPYCFQRCHFCCYPGYKLESRKILNPYISDIFNYYSAFREIFKEKEFTNLYIGGGTPSILSEKSIERLLSEIFSSFNFKKDGEKTFEMSPISASLGKLKVVKKFGFNRVSFGVESFNSKTLKLNNRGYQNYNMVKKAVRDAHSLGFEYISLDLMIGLYGDDKSSVIKNFEKAIELNPFSIFLYPLQPISGYLENTYKFDREQYFNYRQDLFSSVIASLIEIAERKGYAIPDFSLFNFNLGDSGAFSFTKKNGLSSKKNSYIFGDSNCRNSVFGTGFQSSSYIHKKIRYKMEEKLTSDPFDYYFFGNEYDERKEMIDYILRVFSSKKFISQGLFREIFGKDILIEFKSSIDTLIDLNIISLEEDKIYFNLDHPKDRLIYSLFFFDRNDLVAAIERKKNEGKNLKKVNALPRKGLISNEDIEKGNKLIKELEILIEESNKLTPLRVIDGTLVKKNNKSIIIRTKDDYNNFRKIILNDSSVFVEIFLEDVTYKELFKKKILLKKINKNDSLSLLVYDKEDKTYGVIINKMSV